MQTVQELAQSYLKHFKRGTRDNGDSYISLDDDAPEQLTDLVREAHGRMMPDDYKYQFVQDALQAIADSSEGEEHRAIAELEAEHRNSELLAWLGSNLSRSSYVDDEAVGQFGHSDGGIFGDIQRGMQCELEEVANSVLESLNSILEDMAA